MFSDFLVIFGFISTPVLTAVASEKASICRFDEFSCNDGACVSLDLYCDGQPDCADASDEDACYFSPNTISSEDRILKRIARQTQTRRCRKNQWRCRDGTCIGFDGRCDGVVDCPDGSDETFPLCRNEKCQSNWFRCTYGACVDGTAPCNGIQECADNSDELRSSCKNDTLNEVRGQFRCLNGDYIQETSRCDGIADCADGSDETVQTCAEEVCLSYLFQCAYGACVDAGADCNNKPECADGSDESDELCNRIAPAKTTPAPPKPGNCILPPYPDHGRYTVGGAPNASPGQGYETVQLNVTCDPGYGVEGESAVLFCVGGSWSGPLPRCVRYCRLSKHPSVDYRCLVQENSIEGTRECNDQEPAGTTVIPECKKPNYYSPSSLNYMRCIDGNWDYVALCVPGLLKNGTKVTVLIKDTVQVQVSNVEYYVPIFNIPVTNNNVDSTKDKVIGSNDDGVKVCSEKNTSNSEVTDNLVNYEIDESDWRSGKPDGVKININNSSVVVNAPHSKVRF